MRRILFLILFTVFAVRGTAQSLEDTVALVAFMDGVMETHLRDKHIVGATVSMVKDGRLLFAKGYGFSDENKRVRVRPVSTLFRIGSIPKYSPGSV